MFRYRRWSFLIVMVVSVCLLGACAPATPEPAEEPAATEERAEEPAATEEPAEEPAATEERAEEPAATEEPAEEPAAEEEQVLVFANNLDPTTLDPHVASDAQSNIFKLALYEGLVRWKPDTTEIEPWLAEDWEVSEDGLTWTFFLRKGVKFHDGTEMDAEAVKFSFDRMKTIHAGIAFTLDNVESIEVIDDYTIEMTLTGPDVTFFQGLPGIMIVSPTAFQPHMASDTAKGYGYDHEAGTGPFTLVSWQRGTRLEIEKFDDYWVGWDYPHVDRIIEIVQAEPATRRLLLESGDVDLVPKLGDQIDDARALMEVEGITVEQFPTLSSNYLVMANHSGPTADPLVRKAISWAFDYEAMMDIGFGGVAIQGKGPFSSRMLYHKEDLFQYHRDLDKAKELLAEAGYPDGGFDLTFSYVGSSGVQRRAAEILQSSLADVGITVVPDPKTWPALFSAFQDPETAPNMFNLNNHPAFPDPDYTMSRFFHSDAQGTEGFNGGYYENAEVDRLADLGAITLDEDERREMYYKIQELMVEDAPVIWNAEMVYLVGHWDYVKGFQYIPAFSRTLGYLNHIYIDGKNQ
jgi:peptide/nickel transport system substrate-binding protein